MQYQQALKEIERVKRIYGKGGITLGEYISMLSDIFMSFELELIKNDTDSSYTILLEHEDYKKLHEEIIEALK